MRIFSATIATETNTFAPMPTGMASFAERGYFPAGKHPDTLNLYSAPLWAARLRQKEEGWTLLEGVFASAQPSGITTRQVYERLRDELLADLRAALPVDVVLLGLHGAMVAQGYDDCEGDILMRVRALVGANVVVGVELDPHCHMTDAMVDAADVMITFKEYPHTDALDRGHELVELCVSAAQKKIRPVAALVDTGMIVTVHTTREPGRGFVERMQSLEGRDGVLSVSLVHGFSWGDVPGMGTKVLVYADSNVELAQSLARQLANEVIAMRDALTVNYPDIDNALDEALALAGPVVISDGADNPGGGAACDSTFVLRRLVERGITNTALGPIWDPVAVRIAFEAGEGARLPMRLGGKIGPLSGQPIDLYCTVKAIKSDLVMTGLAGTPTLMGDCALVEANGIEIVLISQRKQVMNTDLFTQLGCDIARKQCIVVKSSQHFYASFSQVAKHVIYAAAPGAVTLDLSTLPYQKIQRPKWPIDAMPA